MRKPTRSVPAAAPLKDADVAHGGTLPLTVVRVLVAAVALEARARAASVLTATAATLVRAGMRMRWFLSTVPPGGRRLCRIRGMHRGPAQDRTGRTGRDVRTCGLAADRREEQLDFARRRLR